MTVFSHPGKKTKAQVHQIPVLNDNYLFMIENQGEVLVVDPAVFEPVHKFCKQKKLKVSAILNTHHHFDHVGGNKDIVSEYECPVYASDYDIKKKRVPGSTHTVKQDDTLSLAGLSIEVFEIPGHTLGHVGYFVPQENWLFVGDTLFALGCGRLFEGTPQQMHASLLKICNYPQDSLIFCAHEYTESNLKYHHSVLDNDPALTQRAQDIEKARSHDQPTVPMTLSEEKTTNLFLRAKDPLVRKTLGLESAEDWQVFAQLRERKDQF